jgi:hypothetical protein
MIRSNSLKAFLCAGFLLVVVTSGYGQGWALPAKAPDTPVPCTGCPNVGPNSLTVGYKSPLFSFTGRYLDSSNTSEWFRPFRTARAKFVLPMPALDRIYFRYGDGSVASYKLSTFFERLETGEQLGYWAPVGIQYRAGNPEVWLRWDTWFNPEISDWKTSNLDGSLRMTFFDVDDQGYVYIASTFYGWGIVKDDFGTLGHVMATQVQKYPFTRSDSAPNMIAVVKGDTKYYAILGRLDMWDVTDRKNPLKLTTTNVPVLSHFAKNAAADRIAIVDDAGNLTINTGDGFATGTGPLFSDTGYHDVTSDGTNFFGLKYPDGIVVLSPAGDGYAQGGTTAVDPKFAGANTIKYGDGYLVLTGSDTGGGWDVRVYAVNTDLTATPLVINANPADAVYPSYFRNYYGIPPTNNYAVPAYVNMFDGTVVKFGGKTHLIVCAKGIGDVYELPSAGPTAPPTHVVATATDPTTVRITWTRSYGAASYRIYRGERSGGVITYSLIGSPAGTDFMFDDATAFSNTAYLYKMRSYDGDETADSNVDLATTVIFTDPTLTPYVTTVKSAHFTELLTAVNAVRSLAGLDAIAFTDPTPASGGTILARHLVDLRQGLEPARSELGLTALTYTVPTIRPGTLIMRDHISELRDGVK